MKNSPLIALSFLLIGLINLSSVQAQSSSEDPLAGFEDLFSELESFESESSEEFSEAEEAPETVTPSTSTEELQSSAPEESTTSESASTEPTLSAETQTNTNIEETTSQASEIVEEKNTFIHPRSYYQVTAIPEGKESHILYRTPGAILHRDEKTTLIRTDSSRYFSKYQWCDRSESEVVSNRLSMLKISQGAPKGCREDMTYQYLPYKTFRAQR